MNVLQLSLRNYRVFEEVDLELPARVIGIFGENGAGKSSLMESIAVALYGVGAARTKKQEIRTDGLLTDCQIMLAFEHGGLQYEVRRALTGRGHTPRAELYGGGLLLASGVSDVDDEIQRLLHMDLRVFRASVFAEQKQLDAFSEVTPGKRKDMALRLLGIRPVDDARKAARAEARSRQLSADQLADAVTDIAAAEAELKEAKDRAKDAAEIAKRARLAVKEARVEETSARAAFETIDAARQRVEKLIVAIESATAERDRLGAHREALAERASSLSGQLERLPELVEESARLEGSGERLRLAERYAQLASDLAALETSLERMPAVEPGGAADELEVAEEELRVAQELATRAESERDRAADASASAALRVDRAAAADPSEPCPTCGQPLGDGFAAYRRHVKQELADAKKTATAADKAVRSASSALDVARRRHAKARAAAGEADTIRNERTQLEKQAATKREELREAATPFDGEEPDLEALRSEVARAKTLGHEIAGLLAERKHADQIDADLRKTDAQLADLGVKLDGLTREASDVSYDEAEHELARRAREETASHLEAARSAERDAAGELAQAEKLLSGIEGRLQEARETERRVSDLRSEARYLQRTSMLLDGFRDHLVARVGPELSREAEALFRELTNGEYDDLRIDEETLAIQIADGERYFPVERFSGSEADLANLALRVAISTHLSRVSGADLGLLVLDEVLGSLDQERKDLMVRTMGRLSGRFHQLFVITHAERVKDQFPASIVVSKRGRRRSVAALV
jgi:exonuclease SbcC